MGNRPVTLLEKKAALDKVEEDPCVQAFISLFTDSPDLLQALGRIHIGGQNRASKLTDLFTWIIDGLPAGRKNEIVKIAKDFEACLPPSTDVDRVVSLILEFAAGRYLRMRLKRDLKRSVQVWVAGKQVAPVGNDIDYGFAKGGTSEFYECKVTPWVLFRKGGFSDQCTLLMNVHQAVSAIPWKVVCAVPTFLTKASASLPFVKYKCSTLRPVAREELAQLAKGSPPY